MAVLTSKWRLCFIVTLVFLSIFNASSQQVSIKITKKTFSLKEKLVFDLSNSTDSVIYCYVTLQKANSKDGKWHEIIGDVFSYVHSKKEKVLTLQPRGSQGAFFYPYLHLGKSEKWLFDDSKYRLSVFYAKDPYAEFNSKQFSEDFDIKQ